MSEDRCICCGDIVPEGRMVCPNCERILAAAPLNLEPIQIRCRECRWYSKEQGFCFHTFSNRLCVSEDFYCAFAKRRNTDEV